MEAYCIHNCFLVVKGNNEEARTCLYLISTHFKVFAFMLKKLIYVHKLSSVCLPRFLRTEEN